MTRCDTCRFFAGVERWGNCHRMPKPIYVRKDHWCGEYQRKETK